MSALVTVVTSDHLFVSFKFSIKVIAKGAPDIPLCWMYDLQLSVARLFGELCGATVRVPASSGVKVANAVALMADGNQDNDDWEDEETVSHRGKSFLYFQLSLRPYDIHTAIAFVRRLHVLSCQAMAVGAV